MIQRTLHTFPSSSSVSFFASVRFRLTLWYLATITFIVLTQAWNLYSLQARLATDAVDSQIETQLYQDAQSFTNTYKQVLMTRQSPALQQVKLSTREIIVLQRPDGVILDARGPLTDSGIQQLQARTVSSQAAFNLTFPQVQTQRSWWWFPTNEYRILITPVLNKDTRIAILMVGLPRESWKLPPSFWIMHGILFLLISIIGGYWLASKTMRPVQMITRMAREINATDLRRRLNLKRRDEFGELAATFDQMLARLEAAFKRQAQFTADASHELRTPLTIMNLEINRALTQLQSPEEYRQVLEQMQSENEQMTSIVNSLLLLARADTGQIALRQEKVDLSDIALASVERLLPLARQSQIAVSTGKLPELLVSGDPHYLSQMLMNLVENAIKYTGGIGQRVHVELACEHGRSSEWGVLRVQDDGPGIADDHLPYLFDRFYRVDKARTRKQKGSSDTVSHKEEPGGTGLGLSIVQWIVQAHGGEIRVESKIGAGTVFEVKLPLLKAGVMA